MIRVNLLRNRTEGSQRTIIEPGGASAFISGREVLLAALFLVLGGAILWFVLSSSTAPDPAVAAENNEPAVEAPQPAAPEDSPAPAPAASSPVSSSASAGASPAAVAPAPADAPVIDPAAVRPSPVRPAPATQAAVTPARQTAQRSSPTAPTPPVRAADPPSRSGEITLRELRIHAAGTGLEILAATNGLPEYKMFRVDAPPRIVIDLPGVRHEIPRESREQQVPNSVVKQVRIAQNQLDPPLVRLVLEVDAFPELQVVPRPEGLLITVAGE